MEGCRQGGVMRRCVYLVGGLAGCWCAGLGGVGCGVGEGGAWWGRVGCGVVRWEEDRM